MEARTQVRHVMYRTTVRTAMALSAVVVALSILIEATTDVSQTALVLAVIVVGFIASLVATERAARATTVNRAVVHHGRSHRVTVLPTPHRVA